MNMAPKYDISYKSCVRLVPKYEVVLEAVWIVLNRSGNQQFAYELTRRSLQFINQRMHI